MCVKFKLYYPPLVKLLGFVLLQSYHGELLLSFYLPCLSNCIQILVEFTFNNYIIILSGDRSRLKDDVVPSVFYFKSKEQTPTIPEESSRAKRLKQRSTTDQAQLFNDFDFQYEAVIESFEHRDEEAIEIVDDVPREQGIQCDIPTFCKLSIASVQ